MAGQPAGRLSIEIVAEIARLQQDLDKAKAAVRAASKDFDTSARAANDNIARMGQAGKLAGHQMQNLSYQLNDVVVSLASGQKPMTVFMQQGSQIAQIMASAGVGVKGLVAQIGSMIGSFAAAHPILTAVAVALAAVGAASQVALVQFRSEHRKELEDYAKQLGLTAEEIKKVGGATVTWGDVISGIGKTIKDVFGDKAPAWLDVFKKAFFDTFNSYMESAKTAAAVVYAALVGGYRGVIDIWKGLPAAMGDIAIGAANGVITATNMMLQKAATYVNAFIGLLNNVMANIPGFSGKQIGAFTAPQLGQIANPFAGQAKGLASAVVGEFGKAFNEAKSGINRAIDTTMKNAMDSAKARMRSGAKDMLSGGGSASRKGGHMGKAAGELGQDVGEELAKQIAAALDVAGAQLNRFLKDTFQSEKIQREIGQVQQQIDLETRLGEARINALRGLNGEDLNLAMDAIAATREKDAIATKRQAEADEYREKQLFESAIAVEKLADKEMELVDLKYKFEAEARAAQMFREQVDALAGSLGNIGGGLGGAIGALTSANPVASLLGMGGIGTAAGLLLAPGLIGTLGNSATLSLSKIFNGVGGGINPLAKLLGNGLVGGGLGSLFGKITGSGTGGGIGGAAAGLAGLGPVGIIAGGLLGGLLGGIFRDPDQAVASLTMSGGKAGYGNLFKEGKNKDQYGQDVSNAAGTVANALNSIVGALGGTITSALNNISIGQFKGQWAVNDGSKPGFRGLAAGDPGATVYGSAEAAMVGAIKAAIKQGAVEGLSAGAKTLLMGATDQASLEAQLSKAQAFDAIIKQATEATHPLGEALKALQAQFDELRAVFTEAAATESDYSKLAQFEIDQRKALIASFGQFIADNFTTDAERLAKATADVVAELDKLGLANVTTKAQFKAVADGLDLTTDAGVAMYEALVKIAPAFAMIADAAAERNAQVAADRRALEIELLQTQGRALEATNLQRAAELEALDASLRPLKLAIWAWQDAAAAVSAATDKVADAKQALSAAYDREAGQLTDIANRWRQMGDSLRSFRASLGAMQGGGAVNTASAMIEFMRVSGGAAAGSEADAQALAGAGNAYLGALANSSKSLLEYQRGLALVRRGADAAIAAADSRANAADTQVALLKKQIEALTGIADQQKTVAEAIADLEAAQAELDQAQAERDALGNPVPQLEVLNTGIEGLAGQFAQAQLDLAGLRAEQAALRNDLAVSNASTNAQLSSLLGLHKSWDGGAAIKVMTDGDTLAVDQI